MKSNKENLDVIQLTALLEYLGIMHAHFVASYLSRKFIMALFQGIMKVANKCRINLVHYINEKEYKIFNAQNDVTQYE